jgi:hypothetical protein
MLGEISGGGDEARTVGAAGNELGERLPIELADPRPLRRIGDHDETVASQIATVGRLDRDIDALLDDLAINRAPEIKAPSDGASRRQNVINAGLVHFTPPCFCDEASNVRAQRPGRASRAPAAAARCSAPDHCDVAKWFYGLTS